MKKILMARLFLGGHFLSKMNSTFVQAAWQLRIKKMIYIENLKPINYMNGK